jgi:CBS domain-containing protein
VGRLVGFAFIFWSLWRIFSGYWANGLWLLMIGWFLDTAAAQRYRQLVVQQALAGRRVQEAMIECPPVPRQLTLDAVVDRVVLPSGRRSFPVLEEGRLTLGRISAVPRDEWRLTRAEEAMIPRSELRTVSPADDLATVFRSTTTGDLDQLPVVEDDRFLGMVTRESMERFLRLRANGDAQHPKAA